LKKASTAFNYEETEIKFKLLTVSYILILIALIIYISFSITNILYNNNQIERLTFGNQIADSFLRRIPKFVEMIIYYKISVMLNDPIYLKTDPKDYSLNEYYNHYIIKLDIASDSTFTNLGNSKFAEIYYKLSVTIKTLDQFMSDEKAPIYMPRIYEYEKMLRSKKFCSHIVSEIEKKGILNNTFNANILSEAEKCKFFGSEIESNGFSSAMNLLIAITKNLYLDFINDKSIPRDYKKFLTDDHFKSSLQGVDVIMNIIHDNVKNCIKDDIDELYSKSIQFDHIISIIILLFNLIIAFIVSFYFILKFENTILELFTGISKLNYAIKRENDIEEAYIEEN